MVASLPPGPRVALVDANERTSGAYRADYVASIVGYWLIYEAERAGRHMFSIWPRGPKTVAEHTSDLLSAPPEYVKAWVNGPGCMDLAPTVEDACRLPWEVIRWPWSAEQRWKAAGAYVRAMQL